MSWRLNCLEEWVEIRKLLNYTVQKRKGKNEWNNYYHHSRQGYFFSTFALSSILLPLRSRVLYPSFSSLHLSILMFESLIIFLSITSSLNFINPFSCLLFLSPPPFIHVFIFSQPFPFFLLLFLFFLLPLFPTTDSHFRTNLLSSTTVRSQTDGSVQPYAARGCSEIMKAAPTVPLRGPFHIKYSWRQM